MTSPAKRSAAPRAPRAAFLAFSPPDIDEADIAAVAEAMRSGWITTGPRVKKLEDEFARYVGATGAAAFNSCTAALHTALLALGAGPGDEVITTPNTFCASVNVIEHVGARPVLVDVEADTLNIDPALVARAVTKKTKAIIPVHFAGHPADLDPILEAAKGPGIAVLEDAAHSLPAKYKRRMIGSGANPAAFSFYATKNLTTGEGGMLTGAPDLLDRARVAGLHGMSRDAWKRYDKGGSWFYEVLTPGFKYNMPDIQAALGLTQLAKLERLQRRRREIVQAYDAAFQGEEALEVPGRRSNVEPAWHLYTLRLRGEALTIGRDEFIREMAARNIGTSVHFIPVHLHPFYREKYGFKPADFPVAFSNYERILSIPLHPRLSDDDVSDVTAAVLDIVARHRR
jgi:dTDP-4-amino-4,6-dideoxygalactose transaminase